MTQLSWLLYCPHCDELVTWEDALIEEDEEREADWVLCPVCDEELVRL